MCIIKSFFYSQNRILLTSNRYRFMWSADVMRAKIAMSGLTFVQIKWFIWQTQDRSNVDGMLHTWQEMVKRFWKIYSFPNTVIGTMRHIV